MEIGKLKRVPLREVWRHEAYDFTTWLENNFDVINDVIDLNITSAEREQSTGNFNVDLLAEDASGNTIVIENQLEKSDHDHLGKLITYLSNFDASIAIWIVSAPRPEHVNAITWLNESTSGAFYLLKIEAIQVDDSPPAPLLTLIIGPSAEGRSIGETKRELTERHFIREKFWTGLLQKANTMTSLHSNISPSKDNWISAGAGKSSLGYNYAIRKHDTQVELYIDRGKDQEEANIEIFEHFLAEKEKIENIFDGALLWERLDHRRACRIRYVMNTGGYRDEGKWSEIHDEMVNAMIRLEKALSPHVKTLKV